MQKLISTISMSAALVTVMFSLWRDYSLLVTMKRALIAYVVFFIVSSILALIFRSGIEDEWQKEASRRAMEEQATKPKKEPLF
jgi:hypothetical protein